MSLKQNLAARIAPLLATIERVAFETVMNLPPAVQRRLAGAPVERDGQTLAPDIQLMLRLERIAREPDPSTLSITKGRASLLRGARLAGGRQPIGEVHYVTVAGLAARLYVPSGAPAVGPLLVFLHGGGFMFGDLDSHDAPCRFLAERAGVRLLAVDYRLAPEAPFPAAYDDAVAAFSWAVEHAAELGAEPSRIGVGGDSAGGNLAAGVALAAGESCAFQLLVYPVTQTAPTASRRMFAEGFYLTSEFIDAASRTYLPEGTDPEDPRHAPLYAEIPERTAPAFVATAGFDPLRDEGEDYARKLEEAGVKVTLRRYPGLIHSFFNIIGAGHTAKAAMVEIADVLRTSL